MSQGVSPPGFSPSYERYGVQLRRLQVDELELVRQWRNDPKIASQMLDQTFITPQMQQAWFERLQCSDSACYYVAWFRQQPIGVVSLTAIDWQAGTAEPGMYIYPDEFRSNLVPFCVAFALNDMAFEQLGLTRLYGKIFTTNPASIRFHEACGYQQFGEAEGLLIHYQLVPEHYRSARDQVSRFIRYR